MQTQSSQSQQSATGTTTKEDSKDVDTYLKKGCMIIDISLVQTGSKENQNIAITQQRRTSYYKSQCKVSRQKVNPDLRSSIWKKLLNSINCIHQVFVFERVKRYADLQRYAQCPWRTMSGTMKNWIASFNRGKFFTVNEDRLGRLVSVSTAVNINTIQYMFSSDNQTGLKHISEA